VLKVICEEIEDRILRGYPIHFGIVFLKGCFRKLCCFLTRSLISSPGCSLSAGAGAEPPRRFAPAGSHLSRISRRSLAPYVPIINRFINSLRFQTMTKQQSFRKEPFKKYKL
jgi:hypothetical protein